MSRAQLTELFGQAAMAKDDVASEAMSMCRMFALDADQLWYKWEAFCLASSTVQSNATAASSRARPPPIFNLENARELRKEIQASIKPISTASVKLEHGTPAAKPSLRKSLGRGGLDNLYVSVLRGSSNVHICVGDRLDGLATPQAKKRPFTNNSPFSSSKPTPKPTSHLANTHDDYSTPAKPGSSKLAATSNAATPTLVKSEHATPLPSKFETRTNALEIVESLNAHLDNATPHSSLQSRVKLMSSADPKTYNYRYMFEKIMDRSEALDNRIDELAEVLRSHYGIEELGDPSIDSQEDMICVGRICTDLYAGKLQDASDKSKVSVWLEASRMMGGGHRVELRFEDGLKIKGSGEGDGGAGLFPGGIVGVKGRNVGGQFFNVNEIIMMPPIYTPESSPKDIWESQYGEQRLAGRPLSIITACGPYTTDDNLEYAPFDALIEEARISKPDVLILLGPFIDAHHPAIRSGDIDQLPTQIFKDQISSRLNSLLQSSTATTVILVPALRDILSHHVVYPQSPFERDPELGLPARRVRLLPNPAIFSINEVAFAVTSTDVLFPIRSVEYLKEAPLADSEDADMTPKDQIARACRHVLRQRTFYPVFPAPLAGGGVEQTNLDVTHMDLLSFGAGNGADIVILPSTLGKHFAKIVDSAVLVNPSYLTRGANGGTFARFAIHPMAKAELQESIGKANMAMDELLMEHKVYQRAKIDIVRI